MEFSLFSYIFIVAVFMAMLLQLWLAHRQQSHVSKHRSQVPQAFADKIPLEAHQKAADYTLAKLKIGRIELIYGIILLFAWTLGGGFEWLDTMWRQLEWDTIYIGIGFLISTMVIMTLLDLPFSIYNTFVTEQKFGFNRTTVGVYIGDLLKQFVLMLILGIPLAWIVLWLMQGAGDLWWIYVWAVWMGFSLLMLWAYPAFIAPLFNKFIPLEDQVLKERIETLMDRCGFTSRGIFVMDGSKRSTHGNAYFTGLGENKRIVFFDTLLKSLEPDEVEAVLAHELGHFRRKHIQKRFITMSLFSLAGLALLGWLITQDWFFSGLGISQPSEHTALILFMLVMPVFSIYFQPLFSLFSRKHEFEADDFAAQQSDARKLISALVKLYEENASTLTPDPIYSAFHDSHPPAPVRVAHLSTKMSQ